MWSLFFFVIYITEIETQIIINQYMSAIFRGKTEICNSFVNAIGAVAIKQDKFYI
uniref:Uncharacterized protein n=1 Tax=Erwinia amylovora ATCC BAA-2158 TaxID=889211 RepID=E5B9D4_ERWAM|nr:hypothetical protein predicted by Glimmer/Critica [Erwinia amylovora ATCC BAA-2158]